MLTMAKFVHLHKTEAPILYPTMFEWRLIFFQGFLVTERDKRAIFVRFFFSLR